MGAELNATPPAGTSAPPAALTGQWHGAGLTDLIERLRAAGFRAGAAEAVSAGRLLTRLAAQPRAPTRRADLLAWLRPVFCSTREEQARFDAVFLEWARQFGMAWQPQAEAQGSRADAAAPAAAPARPRSRRAAWIAAAIGVALALAWIGAWRWFFAPSADGPAGPAPVASAPVGPSPAASAASATTPAADAHRPALQGLFAAQRESRSLRPEAVWPLLVAPVLLWLLISGMPSLQLMQGRRRSGRRVVLDTHTLADEARQSLPTLTPAVAGRLERHVRADSGEGAPLARRRRLDARRTVEATLRNHGILSPRYRLAPLRPSYLMLIDAHNEHDPRGRLFYLWAERLKREGLSVDIRLFRPGDDADAAPVCWHGAPAATPTSGQALDMLFDPPPGQRLVVISEASTWLRPDGAWHKWFERARLSRWPQRVFFTPVELRDWGAAEEAVEQPEHAADPGFLTLPLDEAALDAWSVLLASGSLPAFSLAEPQRFPRVLAAPGFDPFSVPAPADADRLIAQLKLYLGDSGFRWLAALAVPPLVRWELTLLLGRALFDHRAALIGERWRDVLGRSYRRLARLPWLRGGLDTHGEHHAPALPDWLRLRLLDELPPDAQAEIRLVVDRLLSRLRPEAGGELPIDLEAPPGDVPRTAARGGASGDGDALYLGYLSGLTPRQLALRLPGGWSDWLKRERVGRPGWSARAVRGATFTREWLRAKLARLAFRDGMPWAGRRLLPLALSAGLLLAAGVAVGVLARWPVADMAPAIEAAFFERTSRAVELPNATNPRAIALSPDGAHALAWGENTALTLWSTASGRARHEFAGGRDALSARFDASGTRVLACDVWGVVRAWPVEGGTPTLIGGLATSDTLRYLDCQISADGRVRLLQPPGDDLRLLVTPEAPQGLRLADTAAALLSPNGRWVLRAAGGGDRTQLRLSVWNVETARALPGEFSGEAAWIDWAGDTLASLVREGGTHSLVLRDLRRGGFFSLALDEDTAAKGADGAPQPYALALSADARYAVIGDTAGGVALWDLEARQRIDRRLVHPGQRALAALRLSDAGDVLLSASIDGDWRVSRAWQPALLRADGDVKQAAISADGRRVAFAYADGRVVLRDVDDAARTTTLAGLEAPTQLVFSADGQRLAQADVGGDLRLWAVPGVQPPVDTSTGEVFGPEALGFDASGLRLTWLQVGGGRFERRVDAAAGEVNPSVNTGGPIFTAARRPDGLIAAIDRTGAEIRLIEPDGSVRRLIAAPVDSSELMFSNRGRTLWVTGNTRAGPRAQAWDVASGRRIDEALALKDTEYSVDGSQRAADDVHQRLATVTADGTLTVYTASGRTLDLPPSGRKNVRAVFWLPDGRLLIADRSGAASVWSLPTAAGAPAGPGSALELGGDPQSIELSADGTRLVAVVTPPRNPPAPTAAPAAANAVPIAATAGTDKLNQAINGLEKARLDQAANRLRELQQQAQIKAAQAPIELPGPGPLAPGANPAGANAAGLWSLPGETLLVAAPGWLGERGGPHPLVLALAGLALAAGWAALNLRRARRRLARRAAGPKAAEGAAPELAEAAP